MKKRFVQIISAVVSLCVAVSITVLANVGVGGNSEVPILYYNDRAWSLSSRFPAEADENGVYYIPLTVFVQLPEVDVRINETLQTFIITHKTRYLSFDTSTNYAANQNKERIPLTTYEKQGERYVPAEIVCTYLGLGYEEIKSPANSQEAIRITDGHETYSFVTLLRRKEPGFYETVPSVETETETEAPETEPPAPTLTERTIYITVEDCPGEYTDDVLSVLAAYGVKATFFVVGDNAAADILNLSRVVAGGHAVALHTMSHDSEALTDADTIISDIESENALLSKTIKLKSRIWRAPEGTALTDEVRADIEAGGYMIWDANVDVPSIRGYQAAKTAINGIWNNRTAVLRFCENQYTADTLRRVLDYIKYNSAGCELRVISGSFDLENQ